MKKWLTLLALSAGLVSTGNAAYINRLKTFTGVASQWPWQLSVDGTWILKRPDASDVSFTQSGTGAVATDLSARAKNRVDVTDFGAVADGTTDNTAAIQAATTYSASVGKVVYFPGATSPYIACHISTASGMGWVGDGPSRSIIKLKNSCNTSLMDNGTSHQIDNVLFYNLGFDGNRANNSDGDMIVTYGAHPTIVNVYLWDVAGHAVQTSWDSAYASRKTGFEGFYQNVKIDTVNKSCWINNGPNDSRGSSINMVDCSLNSSGSYYGMYMAGYGNGRWDDIHYSNRDVTTNVPAAGVYVGSNGNTFVSSHFEGGVTPLVVAATANVIEGMIYAPRGAYAMQLLAGYNTVKGNLCAAAASINPNYIGVNLASSGNLLDFTSGNCNNGVIDFGSDPGNNVVRVRGYQASGTAVANYLSRNGSTVLDLEVTGGATSGSHHDLGNFSYVFGYAPAFAALNGLVVANGGSAATAILPGTGVASALAVSANASGGFAKVNGSPTGGDLLVWNSSGVTSGGAPGTDVLTALGVAANASGGFSKVNGTITAGNALKWSSSGVTDAGIAAPTVNTDGAWNAYTPTTTYPGTAPTAATVSGTWKQLGSKTYVVHINYNVTTLGSGSGNIYFGLPNGATLAHNAVCSAVNYSAGIVQSSTAATVVGGVILSPSPAMAAQQYYINCTFEAN